MVYIFVCWKGKKKLAINFFTFSSAEKRAYVSASVDVTLQGEETYVLYLSNYRMLNRELYQYVEYYWCNLLHI